MYIMLSRDTPAGEMDLFFPLDLFCPHDLAADHGLEQSSSQSSSGSSDQSDCKRSKSRRSDCSEEELALKRQRQRLYSHTYYRRRISPFSPVYKNDIRRQFGTMFVNTINHCDFRMYRQFFLRFTDPACSYRHVFHLPAVVQQLFPTAVEESVLDHVVLHSAYCFGTIPDVSAKLAECKITQAAFGHGSTVSVTVTFAGTRMYELGNADDRTFARFSSVISDRRSLEHDSAAPISALPYLDEATITKMRVPTDHALVDCKSTFVFKLDASHAIVAFEQHWCSIDMSLPCGVAPPRPPCAETYVPDIFPLSLHPELPADLSACV